MAIEQIARAATGRRPWMSGIGTVLPGLWVGSALICIAAGLISVLLGPDNNWDLRYYHLYAPWAYLHDRYLYDVGPAQYQGFFNPVADLLFYGLLSLLNDHPRWIAFIMGAVHGLNAVVVAALAWQVLRPDQPWQRAALAAVATVIGISGADALPLLGNTTNDLINSIFVLAALLLALRAATATDQRATMRMLALAGVAAGVGVGLKFTAAIFLPGVAAAAAMAAWQRRSFAGLIAFGAGFGLAFIAIAGHHMLTLWGDFGNPMFPLLNNIFQSPDYEPVSIHDDQFLPRGLWQLLTYPFFWTKTNIYVVSEMSFRDWRAAMAYVAIVAAMLAALLRLRRPPQPRETRGLAALFAFIIISYFVWALVFGNYRYAVTLEMLTGVAIIGALVSLLRDRGLRVALAAAVLLVLGLTTVYPDWGHRAYGSRYVDVQVPPLPAKSVVLIATEEPVAYFIPFAEPSAQYLGIENNYLDLSQHNGLTRRINTLMRAPGRPKFIVSEGEFDAAALNAVLARFKLKLAATPCRPIRSNFPGEALALCEAIVR